MQRITAKVTAWGRELGHLFVLAVSALKTEIVDTKHSVVLFLKKMALDW